MSKFFRRRVLLGGGGGARLYFIGPTTLAEDFSGVALTLFVSGDADYDTFAEVTDDDDIATLVGDEVSISGLDYETATSHTLVFSAEASAAPSKPTLTLTINITVTDVSEGGLIFSVAANSQYIGQVV